jgi:hypothetical protein
MVTGADGMMEHFNRIKTRYDDFVRFLLWNNILPARDTGIGYWGTTPLLELRELFTRLSPQGYKRMIDLGSGDGRVVLLASLFGIEAHGIEFDPWLVNSSLFIRRKLDLPSFEQTKFREGNFMHHDISGYDLVYTSPDKPFNRNSFEDKLLRELSGDLIVHGWEFHPTSLKEKETHIINGEKFVIYSR